uniref:Ankyrin repeat domain-containing protein 29 n=1 Tax=Panagrolaimus sp. JU765 TaxID=591449 RepID=A0AC34QQ40_9BILA
MRSAGNGHSDACILLIDEGANVNATKPDGATALMYASQNGHVEVIEILIKEGAKADLKTKEGGTALLHAAQTGQTNCCGLLLSSGNSKIDECLKDGANSAFLASQNGHLETLKILNEFKCNLNLPRIDGTTCLWISSQLGHDNIVQFLISNGVQDYDKYDGGTALFKASQKGFEKIVEILLQYPANLGILKNGESALHAAALFGNLRIAKMLLAAGADPNLQNKHSETPLDLAIQMNYEDIVQLFKKRI